MWRATLRRRRLLAAQDTILTTPFLAAPSGRFDFFRWSAQNHVDLGLLNLRMGLISSQTPNEKPFAMKPQISSLRRWVVQTLLVITSAASVASPDPITEGSFADPMPVEIDLPDPLAFASGQTATTPEVWREDARPQILRSFENEVYGRTPQLAFDTVFEEVGRWDDALSGKATLSQMRARFSTERGSHSMDIVVFAPNRIAGKAPVFVGLNFHGNHTIHPDPRIAITEKWVPNCEHCRTRDNAATAASRGAHISRWPIERLIDRGYAVASVYCGDLDPDFDDGFQNGIHPLFYREGQTRPQKDEWGTIGAWAWGLSRVVDYLEKDDRIDSRRIGVVGHSRLGKAALWAGAQDQRFAIVVSNESGCGGAALSKRKQGETVADINTRFPHWFSDTFTAYNGREEDLPLDQHMLLSLMAPRGLYVASAVEDQWADPRGEFLALKHAEPVFGLFDLQGLSTEEMPTVDTPVTSDSMGYHIRSGEHDLTAYDWEMFMNFADRHYSSRGSAPE